MDEESLWVLKMLAARQISARSADRILQALDLLRKSEVSKERIAKAGAFADESFNRDASPIAFASPVVPAVPVAEEESKAAAQPPEPPSREPTGEDLGQPEVQAPIQEVVAVKEEQDITEAKAEASTVEKQIETLAAHYTSLGDEGVSIVEGIPDGAEMILEQLTGNVTIQGWDQPFVKAEGRGFLLQNQKYLKIKSKDNMELKLYIPSVVKRINADSISGSLTIEKYPSSESFGSTGDIVIASLRGDISVREASSFAGSVRVKTISGNISLDSCRCRVSLESEEGLVIVSKCSSPALDSAEEVGAADIYVKSNGKTITLEECSGRNIYVESNGGELLLRDVAAVAKAGAVELKCENGNIAVENFSGRVRVKALETDISLKNSGDAEIHVESDGGDIVIRDCYADVYITSGTGNVQISGGSLAFGGMGKVDLKMKAGDAYLHRRTFEEIQIAIEDGNVDLNMEKLNSGGNGRISVNRGDIAARISPGFKCEVIAQAPSDKIAIAPALPVEIVQKSESESYSGSSKLHGILNGAKAGGSKLELIAPNGEIRLMSL